MGHHRHMDDASSISSYSSAGSSRSSSRSSSSSGSSKKSRSSQVSHSNIKSDHWAVSLMKYTAGAPFGKPMSLRKTKVRELQGAWDYDDDDDDSASIYSNVSYTTYAWVKPKWDDSISEIASRSDSRSSGRRRRGPNAHGRPRFTAPPHTHQHPPPFNHPPPPPPHFMTPPGAPVYDEGPGFFDLNPGFYPPPPPPPPADSGGAPAFFDLSGGGGGGNHPGKYDDWE
ncbi:uncharacterized protein LY79DRAFT_554172 [Colletotrichum navitas]|uniref:Uncharacterized protein n=1 Tax=Colletotrichum navitas TaxID=681940 RepID=A0AAD8V389_9PEZI|nr:uncharacterized protein LY79DRAFT_554172 [Colletotrichum navitas]KAK1590550.1 hypothetical protein LY79DRAFT_554172 [Colletotrichum navitas]